MVSGAAALVLERHPALKGNAVGLRAELLKHVRPIAGSQVNGLATATQLALMGGGGTLDLSAL